MTLQASLYPSFPPGFHRRIMLQPGPGFIGGALEDDMHRFHLRIDHADGRITAVVARAVRHPWSACPGATDFIAKDLTGQLLEDVARRDPNQHCTHLIDLAVLAAAHATDNAPTRVDMFVADRVEQRTTATLAENGEEKLRWLLDDLAIAEPGVHAGLNLRQLSKWKQELPAPEAERATLLRRAVMVSGARQYKVPDTEQTAASNPGRMGACFNYQLPQAAESTRSPNWHRDFSETGHEPLEGLNPEAEFAAMGMQ